MEKIIKMGGIAIVTIPGRELRGRLCRALLCFLCCFCLAWIKGGRRIMGTAENTDQFNDDLNDRYIR